MGTRPAALISSALGTALLLGACGSGKDPGPDPTGTVTALVSGLAADDLSRVAFVGATSSDVGQQYDDTVIGLGDLKPKVQLVRLDRPTTRTATAVLDWTWPLDTGWTYQTKASLRLVRQQWQVAWAPSLVEPSLKQGQKLGVSTVTAKRGDILGAGGVGLVTDRPVIRFGVDRTKVKGKAVISAARTLARLVGIGRASYVKAVQASGPEAFVEAIVYRQDQVPRGLVARVGRIKGVDAIAGELPLGITKEFAASILGTVGPVTADMVKQDPTVYRPGDEAGLSGLEARYDEQLRGTPGLEVDAIDPDGTRTSVFKTPAVAGKPLRLTIDDSLQSLAEQILANTKPASAIVAIRPSTGAILAAANGPGTKGYNDATYGRFAPGSTFKTVDSLALLKHGLTPSSTVSCPTSVNVNGKVFTNDSFYPPSVNGRIPLATALAFSCNTAFINERTQLGPSDLVDAAATLGMGVDHDLGFPAYFGNVVPPASETEKAADMIGQGQILASPMTMATVMASVVAGHTVVPQLVKSVTPAATTPTRLTAGQAAKLKVMLRRDVTRGTGLALDSLPGPPVIAKTGTAEFDRNGKRLTHTWMIGAQGDLAVCAFVDVGETGAGTAGPLLKAFLQGARAR